MMILEDSPDASEIELLKQAGLFFGRADSPRSRRRLLEVARARCQRLKLTPTNYLARLRREATEWGELWHLFDLGERDTFFRYPAQFELLSSLLLEKAVLASDRTLKVLSVASRLGHEAYSLAMVLSATGLTAKGWKITVEGFDSSSVLVRQAEMANYKSEDLGFLEPATAKRWFIPRAGNWHFRTELASEVRFFELNFADTESELLTSLFGTFDVIFCRGLSFDCHDRFVGRLAQVAISLLAPEGLLFTAPGEFWPLPPEARYEERDGVIYIRKISPKAKPNVFFTSKKAARGSRPREVVVSRDLLPESFNNRLLVLSDRFREVLETDADEARELVLEMLSLESGQGTVSSKTLSMMLEVEEKLNRPNCAGYLKAFLAALERIRA
jgi:chemotaxis methyl-accepting protein methylase